MPQISEAIDQMIDLSFEEPKGLPVQGIMIVLGFDIEGHSDKYEPTLQEVALLKPIIKQAYFDEFGLVLPEPQAISFFMRKEGEIWECWWAGPVPGNN